MALSKKLFARIAIGVTVAIIVLFIVWKIRNKSKYTVTSLKTGAAGSIEESFYSNVSNCQNTFTTSTLGSVMVFSSLTCTGSTVTATTLVPHKYTTGQTVYIQGASSDGTTTGSTFGYNTKPGVPTSVTWNSATMDVRTFTYPAVEGSCSATPTLSQFGYSYLSTDTNTVGYNTIRDTCISSNVSSYMEKKCPWTSKTPSSTAAAGTPEATAYQAYQTYQANLTKVKDAYANIVLTAPSAPSSTKASKDQIQAAREADFTAATRQYLNATCPNYYAQITGVDPGTGAVSNIPNSPYNGYVADTTNTTGVNGFNKTLITDANILNWAKYASTLNPIVTDAAGKTTGGDFSGTAPLTASTAAGDPLRYSYKTGSTTFASGMANWQIAQDIGPGTVTMSGTIPSTTAAAGTAVTSALVMNNAV